MTRFNRKTLLERIALRRMRYPSPQHFLFHRTPHACAVLPHSAITDLLFYLHSTSKSSRIQHPPAYNHRNPSSFPISPHRGGGAYTIPAGFTYSSTPTPNPIPLDPEGPAYLLTNSSRALTSRSFCISTQQQQQSDTPQSLPMLPRMWYKRRMRVRWREARIPVSSISQS